MISTWDFIQSYLTTGCRVDICIHQQLRGTNLHQVTLQENINFFFLSYAYTLHPANSTTRHFPCQKS